MPTLEEVMTSLPFALRFEIDNIRKKRSDFLTEIRLRIFGSSFLYFGRERVRLLSNIDEGEMLRIFEVLTDGAVYAHRERLSEGYLTIDGGVRVGVVGKITYDRENVMTVTDISALVFRIPSSESELGEQLYEAFIQGKGGMLIYSPPGVGKTSAVRKLVRLIGEGKEGKNVVVVDERGEFLISDYQNTSVDILSGYRKAHGMEIALRTLSPEVLALDEIGSPKEAELIRAFVNAGVRVIATIHSDSLESLSKSSIFLPFLSMGAFDVYAGLYIDEEGRKVNIHKGVFLPS